MRKLFSLFAALALSVGLWAQGSVFTYTATEKLEEQFSMLGTVVTHDFNGGNGTVTFDGELTSIPDMAFTECMGLISIELPESVTEIGGFLMCTNLRDVIAANVRTIGHDAFSGCNNLQSIDLSNVTTIGDGAFNYCLNLQSVFMPNVEEIGSTAFNSCQNLQSVFMPNVTTIESYTFAYCENLQSIDLSNVTTIGNNAFQWCGLQSVTVPATLTEIGGNAFVGCQQLQSVTFLGNACQNAIGEDAFSGVGNPDPALLTLPYNWTGTIPDEDGNWYGGKFELSSIPGLTTYLDENGEEQEIVAAEVENASEAVTWGTAGQTTWFVVNGEDVQLSKGAVCAGDVRLILADNAKLTATGWYDETYWIGYAGIQVSGEGNSLTIYAQSVGEQMGQLIATGGESGAGIGGEYYGSGSNITINGGVIEATGGSGAAGIGGGNVGDGSNITINGGTVTATGGWRASGIGGGDMGSGSNITINGGIVTATGGEYGAGIGGGGLDGSNITINGGEVTAIGGVDAAGIGGGAYAFGFDITINGGKVTATGSGTGIGGGNLGFGYNITINGGEVTATGGENAAGIGGGDHADGYNITINGGTITANGGMDAAGIGSGKGRHGYNITINSGEVTATGGDGGAGIGGGSYAELGSNIVINGGTVTANGGQLAAGIGGGSYGELGSNIVINGGTVTANGGQLAAGIGSGSGSGYEDATSSNIYISDAYVLKAGAAANPTDVIAHSSAQNLGGTLTQQYAKVQGLATPYTRSMTIDNWATVCLPYAATSFSGATFYKVNYYNASENALYVEEVTALAAGMPYIFQATADVVTIEHAGVATLTYGEEQNFLGLYGSFARKTIAYDGAYAYAAIANNAVNVVEEEYNITVPACRAYLDMNEVATSEQPHKAPLRAMGVPRGQATNNENVNADGNMNGKFIINGQFVIVKDGKKINALGF